jgi:hypothetical protein
MTDSAALKRLFIGGPVRMSQLLFEVIVEVIFL